MVFQKELPPQKVPLKGHVPLLLSPELLAWIEAHPDDWLRYEAYAHACTKPQEHEDLLEHLEGWSNTRSKEGQLEAVVDEYSESLDKAEEGVKDMTPGVKRAGRVMKTLSALLTSSILKIAGQEGPQVEGLRRAHGASTCPTPTRSWYRECRRRTSKRTRS